MVGPVGKRSKVLQDDIVAAGGHGAPGVAAMEAELEDIRGRLDRFARADLLLLGIAVVTMATARYW